MRLLAKVHAVGARRRLAATTVDCYWAWIEQFLRFCRVGEAWRRPAEIFAGDVEAFLTYLARDRRLSASSQNQACSAIVFLYKHVLVDELAADHLGRFVAERSKRPVRIPTVLSVNEVGRLIESGAGEGAWKAPGPPHMTFPNNGAPHICAIAPRPV